MSDAVEDDADVKVLTRRRRSNRYRRKMQRLAMLAVALGFVWVAALVVLLGSLGTGGGHGVKMQAGGINRMASHPYTPRVITTVRRH